MKTIKRVTGLILIIGGIVLTVFFLLPSWTHTIKKDLAIIENPLSLGLGLLPILIDWAIRIGVTGFLAIAIIGAGIGMMINPSSKTEDSNSGDLIDVAVGQGDEGVAQDTSVRDSIPTDVKSEESH